jgi:hypothetical protein
LSRRRPNLPSAFRAGKPHRHPGVEWVNIKTKSANQYEREENDMPVKNLKVLIRGGGELATAVACRLADSHFKVIMTEVAQPQAVRRNVSFCEAVYEGTKTVEGKTARLVSSAGETKAAWKAGQLALIVDPDVTIRSDLLPDVEIDAIIAKKNLGTRKSDAELVIGLGIGTCMSSSKRTGAITWAVLCARASPRQIRATLET